MKTQKMHVGKHIFYVNWNYLRFNQAALALWCVLAIFMITACHRDNKPKDPNRNTVGDRYYEWGKPENIHKPRPAVLELKAGSMVMETREESEAYMSTYRIERPFVFDTPRTWGWPVELRVPLAILDKTLTVEEYTEQYEASQYQTRTNYPYLAFTLNPAFRHEDIFDLNNWQTWRTSRWYGLKSDISHGWGICEPQQFDKQHNYYFCDYVNRFNKLTDRYYWAADSKNVDPVIKQPVIFACSYEFKDCVLRIGYDNGTDILILGTSDKAEVTKTGIQTNVFLYADYMPKIIEFLNERKVN